MFEHVRENFVVGKENRAKPISEEALILELYRKLFIGSYDFVLSLLDLI